MDIPTTEEVSGLMGAISALIIALWRYREVVKFFVGIGKALYSPIKKIVQWFKLAQKLENDNIEIFKNLSEINESLIKINSQLKTNGGSTLLDKINRIETRMIVREHTDNALLQDDEKGIFRCDITGSNLWVNRTYARWLGCGTNELLSFGWRRFIDTDELEKYSKVWQAAFKDGCEFDYVVTYTDTQGDKIRLLIRATPITDDKNEVIGYIGQAEAV